MNDDERENTTQEWTVENGCILTRRTEEDTRMFVFPKGTSPDLLDSICETHNRSVSILCNAIKIQRANVEKAAIRAELAQIELAAERKMVLDLENQVDNLQEELAGAVNEHHKVCQKQLTAEREKRKLSEREWCGLVQQLREELAAERDAKETFCAALYKEMEQLREQLAAERLRIWREAPDQPDVQEAVIAKLDLVHRHAIEKRNPEIT